MRQGFLQVLRFPLSPKTCVSDTENGWMVGFQYGDVVSSGNITHAANQECAVTQTTYINM